MELFSVKSTTIAFLPFSTSLISSYGDHAIAVDFYAANLSLTSSLYTDLWLDAVASGRLVDVQPSRQESLRTDLRMAVPSLGNLASIGIAMWSTSAAEYSGLSIPVLQSAVSNLFGRFSSAFEGSNP